MEFRRSWMPCERCRSLPATIDVSFQGVSIGCYRNVYGSSDVVLSAGLSIPRSLFSHALAMNWQYYHQSLPGGRGKKGGLAEYAEKIGKHKTTVGEWIKAGEVYQDGNCRDVPTVYAWTERTFQLAAIHKLPKSCWQGACEWLSHVVDYSRCLCSSSVPIVHEASFLATRFDDGGPRDGATITRCSTSTAPEEATSVESLKHCNLVGISLQVTSGLRSNVRRIAQALQRAQICAHVPWFHRPPVPPCIATDCP